MTDQDTTMELYLDGCSSDVQPSLLVLADQGAVRSVETFQDEGKDMHVWLARGTSTFVGNSDISYPPARMQAQVEDGGM
jgi:hypothetical protein